MGQRIAITTAARISSIKQVTRLAVLNTSADSRGINQQAHYSIDQFASPTGVPYSTIRPAIFSASLLAAARQVRASRTWTGLAGSGRMALIDHRDAAEAGLRVLTEPALWGAHHDLTMRPRSNMAPTASVVVHGWATMTVMSPAYSTRPSMVIQ
jgi:NAD(P)H dehydrogenase (quinone)